MKKLITQIAVALALLIILTASNPEVYQWYNKNGKKSSFQKVVKACTEADVVLFGEFHNDAVHHWMEKELLKALNESWENELALGAEMLESDNQLLLDEYLNRHIRDKDFKNEARLWNNHATDYKPLVEFARDHEIPFYATNIPRRYAAYVARNGIEGLEKLPSASLEYIAPLPVAVDSTLPGYNKLLNMPMGPHGNSAFFMEAQAIKDATMAHHILEGLRNKKHFLHFNGAYHSNNFEGISHYLKQSNPDLKIVTISGLSQGDVNDFDEENKGLADFILISNDNMTKTY